MTVSGPASGGNRPESLSGGAYPDQEKGKPCKPWWRRLIKVLLIVAVSLAGLFVLLGGMVWLVLTPPRLTPLVNRVATKYLNAEVHFDTVRLSLFENFPARQSGVEKRRGDLRRFCPGFPTRCADTCRSGLTACCGSRSLR